jgi:hypothetical protein
VGARRVRRRAHIDDLWQALNEEERQQLIHAVQFLDSIARRVDTCDGSGQAPSAAGGP